MDDHGEEMPELATNDEWRRIMIQARKDQGFTQASLGAEVGLSQVMISKLEGGESTTSTHILRICRVLSIPEPRHYADEQSRSWSELGHVLRHGDPDEYEAIVNLVEKTAKRIEKEQQAAREAKQAETRPTRSK